MATCHIIIAIITAKNQHQWETHSAAGWAAVSMVWLFVVFFGYSWGPCAWIVIAEIWPLSQRPYGIALGASSNWMVRIPSTDIVIGYALADVCSEQLHCWASYSEDAL